MLLRWSFRLFLLSKVELISNEGFVSIHPKHILEKYIAYHEIPGNTKSTTCIGKKFGVFLVFYLFGIIIRKHVQPGH